ncbi:MAG: virginiamycin A acetyltransferase [Paraglaciecola sp.]|jgi:virginiamycin A acetyltransferase
MKSILKQILFIIAAVIALPFTLSFSLLSFILPQDTLLASISQCLSLIPTKLGNYIRAGFYRFVLTKCSPDAVVSFLVLLSQQDTEIGAGVYIGPQCNIGKCKIGPNTLLGSGVHIMSGKEQHNFDDVNSPIKNQGGNFEKISIGMNSWIGNGAMIMANIGEGCVIGAGSVVINDIPDFAIVAGNPAKVIRIRT